LEKINVRTIGMSNATIDSYGVFYRGREYAWYEITQVEHQFNLINFYIRDNKGRERRLMSIISTAEIVAKVNSFNPSFVGEQSSNSMPNTQPTNYSSLQNQARPKRRTGTIIFCVTLFILAGFSAIMIPLSFFIWINVDEGNTTEFTATIESIPTNYRAFSIRTQEYRARLTIDPWMHRHFNDDLLDTLSVGDVIVFRIFQEDERRLSRNTWVDVIYLRAGTTQIISFEQSNEYSARMRTIFIVSFSIATAVTLIPAWIIFRHIRRPRTTSPWGL